MGPFAPPLQLPLDLLVFRGALFLDRLLGFLEEFLEEKELVGIDLLGAAAEDAPQEDFNAGLKAPVFGGERAVQLLQGQLLVTQDRVFLLRFRQLPHQLLKHGGMVHKS